jgi:hypothetical protein
MQKQELRDVLALLEAAVCTSSDERFFGATVSYLLGATFSDTTHIESGAHVHGVVWEVNEEETILVSVHLHEQAIESAKAGHFVFTPAQQVQVVTAIDYLRKICPEKVARDHASSLAQAVKILRERPNGF